MKKHEFILWLRDNLSCLPRQELEERLAFYDEMIQDWMEEGLSEEEAVSQMGDPEEIAAQIIQETPLPLLVKEKIKPKGKLKAWNIALLVLGSPIWLSLLAAVFAVVISLYAALWSVVISLWSCFAAVAACAPAGILGGIVFITTGHGLSGAALMAASLVCGGLSIFLFISCKFATKGAVWLSKQVPLALKRSFMKKEDAQ